MSKLLDRLFGGEYERGEDDGVIYLDGGEPQKEHGGVVMAPGLVLAYPASGTPPDSVRRWAMHWAGGLKLRVMDAARTPWRLVTRGLRSGPVIAFGMPLGQDAALIMMGSGLNESGSASYKHPLILGVHDIMVVPDAVKKMARHKKISMLVDDPGFRSRR